MNRQEADRSPVWPSQIQLRWDKLQLTCRPMCLSCSMSWNVHYLAKINTLFLANMWGQRLGSMSKYCQAGVVSSVSLCETMHTVISESDGWQPTWGFISLFSAVHAGKSPKLHPKLLIQSQKDSIDTSQKIYSLHVSLFLCCPNH